MWAFLLGTTTGRCLAALVAAAALGLALWIAGDVHGHKAQAAKDATAIATAAARASAAEQANGTNLATIDKLRDANARWAAQAEASEGRAQAAVNALMAEQAASDAALAKTKTQLREAIHATPDARQWGATRVPGAVLCRLRAGAGCPH